VVKNVFSLIWIILSQPLQLGNSVLEALASCLAKLKLRDLGYHAERGNPKRKLLLMESLQTLPNSLNGRLS